MRSFFLASALCLMASLPAWAGDYRPSIDEESGDWLAVSFHDGPSTIVCAAGREDHKLAFRADKSDLEIRSEDASWSLPATAEGDMTLTAGTFSSTFHVRAMDAQTLTVIVGVDAIVPLFDAMDKASSLSMRFGDKRASKISLTGSTKIINSFRTCAGTSGFANLGSSTVASATPFQ